MTILGSDKVNLLSFLEGFDPDTTHGLNRHLFKYLQCVASSGQTLAPWKLVQPVILWACARAMDSMQSAAPCPLLTDKSHVNERFDIIPYAQLRSHILDQLRSFVAAPFTVQRLCELILVGLELDAEAFIDEPPNSDTVSNVQSVETLLSPSIKPSETTVAAPESPQPTHPLEPAETSAPRVDDAPVEQSQSFSQTSLLDSTASVAATPNRSRAGPSGFFVKRQYIRTDKYLRALEKTLQVVSTVDPFGKKYLEDPRFASASEEIVSAGFLKDSSMLMDASETRLRTVAVSPGALTPRTVPESAVEMETSAEGAPHPSTGVDRLFQNLFEAHVPLVVAASRTPPPNPMSQVGTSPTHERPEQSDAVAVSIAGHLSLSPPMSPTSEFDSALGDRDTASASTRTSSTSSAVGVPLLEAMQVDTELEPSDELEAERSSTPEFMPPESETPASPLAGCWPRSPARSPSHSPCEPVPHTPGSPRYVGAVDEVDFSATLHVPLAAAFAAAAHPSHVDASEADDRREIALHPEVAHRPHSPPKISEPDAKHRNEGHSSMTHDADP